MVGLLLILFAWLLVAFVLIGSQLLDCILSERFHLQGKNNMQALSREQKNNDLLKRLSLPLSPSKGQYYHAIELKREHYDNVVTSLQQPHQKLVITLVQIRYGKFDKQHCDSKRYEIV